MAIYESGVPPWKLRTRPTKKTAPTDQGRRVGCQPPTQKPLQDALKRTGIPSVFPEAPDSVRRAGVRKIYLKVLRRANTLSGGGEMDRLPGPMVGKRTGMRAGAQWRLCRRGRFMLSKPRPFIPVSKMTPGSGGRFML
jgi:hypothetical protein